MGNLQKIIDDDKKLRDERSVALSGAGPPLAKIEKFGSITSDETSNTLVCKVGAGGSQPNFTLKVLYKSSVVEHKQEEAAVRELDLLKTMSKNSAFSSCPCLPSLKSTYTDKNNLCVCREREPRRARAGFVRDRRRCLCPRQRSHLH